MPTAVLTFRFHMPGVHSLKEKRSAIKPILARLHKEFNLSTAEMDLQDHWQDALISCAMVGSDHIFLERAMQKVKAYTARMWPDLILVDEKLEIW